MFSTKQYSKNVNLPVGMNVKTDTLEPRQQKTNKRFKISADIYQQRFLKFQDIAIFHSYHELLYAGLLESNPDVTYFVPQPHLFMIGKRRYVPDCYFVKNGKRYIVEIKPEGKLKEEILRPIKEFLSLENIKFKVVSNEKIRSKEQLAQNWLHIVRVLNSARDLDTSGIDKIILEQTFTDRKVLLGDFVDASRRNEDFKKEVSIYRLAHQGKIKLSLADSPIDFDTEIQS